MVTLYFALVTFIGNIAASEEAQPISSCSFDHDGDLEGLLNDSVSYCNAVGICNLLGMTLLSDINCHNQNKTHHNRSVWFQSSSSLKYCVKEILSPNLVDDNRVCPYLSQDGIISLDNCTAKRHFQCQQCTNGKSLGLETGLIKDQDITTSSYYKSDTDPTGFQGKFARLNLDYSPGKPSRGGWCSGSLDDTEYIQVDFRRKLLITGIKVQGVTLQKCQIWTTQFKVSHSLDNKQFIKYLENNTVKLFQGNKNGTTISKISVSMRFISRYIRIHPMGRNSTCQNQLERSFCLRLEIYGCEVDHQLAAKLLVVQKVTVKF